VRAESGAADRRAQKTRGARKLRHGVRCSTLDYCVHISEVQHIIDQPYNAILLLKSEAAHYSAFTVARCSHLFRFVPLDSFLDNCMARASDHSALSTSAALQLVPDTQMWFSPSNEFDVAGQTPHAGARIFHGNARCNGDDNGLSTDVGHSICHCRTKPLPVVWRHDSFTSKTTPLCMNSPMTEVVQGCGMAGLVRPQGS